MCWHGNRQLATQPRKTREPRGFSHPMVPVDSPRGLLQALQQLRDVPGVMDDPKGQGLPQNPVESQDMESQEISGIPSPPNKKTIVSLMSWHPWLGWFYANSTANHGRCILDFLYPHKQTGNIRAIRGSLIHPPFFPIPGASAQTFQRPVLFGSVEWEEK